MQAARDTKTATKAVAARMHRLRMKTAKDLELGDHGDHIFGKPTTGMAVLYALKDICHAVTLYGFGTHDDSGNPTTYKYYRQTTTDVQTASVGLVGNTVSGTVGSHAHSFLFEQEMLHALDHVRSSLLSLSLSLSLSHALQLRSCRLPLSATAGPHWD